jgi:hypothetical protein
MLITSILHISYIHTGFISALDLFARAINENKWSGVCPKQQWDVHVARASRTGEVANGTFTLRDALRRHKNNKQVKRETENEWGR